MGNQAVNMALGVAICGVLAFLFGVVAENKKPAQGTAVLMKGYVLCKFPKDPTVALGSLSVAATVMTASLGMLAIFFPYKGERVPRGAIFQGNAIRGFFFAAVLASVLGEAMMLWATITEGLHRSQNKHKGASYECPTAKTGLFGGAAFIALDASLFWLVCQMLALNARADFFDDEDDDPKPSFANVLASADIHHDSNNPDANNAVPNP